MTAKTFKYPAAVLGLTIAIFLGPSLASAQYGGAASPSPAPSPAQNTPQTKDSGKPAQKVNKAEEAAYKSVLAAQGGDPAMQITIDIESGTLEALSAGIETGFPLDEFTRARLLNGWDDIGLTLRYEDEIESYEADRASWLPTTR